MTFTIYRYLTRRSQFLNLAANHAICRPVRRFCHDPMLERTILGYVATTTTLYHQRSQLSHG